jgi:NAD(P)H-dependent FMN reductase
LGHPDRAKAFFDKISQSDGLIISFAEHNGAYTAAYKSLFDWCSRIDSKVFQNKPMILLSTFPGSRGGATVLSMATASTPFFGGHVIASICAPSFNQNFDLQTNCVVNEEINLQIRNALKAFIEFMETKSTSFLVFYSSCLVKLSFPSPIVFTFNVSK